MIRAGQVAIITGAASGIGAALAAALAARGVRLVLADIDGQALAATAARLRAGGAAVETAEVDVTDAAAMSELVRGGAARQGQLDYMFNNAGIAVSGDARDLTVAHWRRVVEVNLMGVVHGIDPAYRVMCAQGHGHLVNIASLAGLVPFPSNAPYGATKHAVVGLSLALRTEGEALGVKVSVVCPGFVESNIYTASEAVNVPRETLAARIPFRKVPAAVAAERILAGLERNSAVIVFPFYARLFWWLQRLHGALLAPLGRRLIRDLRALRTAP
jgi:short-subunit dehydrogenase